MVFEHDFKAYPELTNQQMDELEFVSPHRQIKEDFEAVVVKVHDGDTITVEVDFRDFAFPVRLVDIDAPELNDGGEVAAEWLRERILGETVEIRIDPDHRVGKYGRLLGRVFSGGLDVGQEELYLGLASEFGARREGEIPDINYLFNEVEF